MALTSDRNTTRKAGDLIALPVKAGAVIYAGSIVALQAGYAVSASDTADLIVIGRAEEFIDNTNGANGDQTIQVLRNSAFLYKKVNIAQANAGSDAYIVDDETVGLAADTTNSVKAGKILSIEDDQVWVEIKQKGF